MAEEALTPAEAKRLRNRHGWSLQFLAKQTEVNKAYLSEFENGLRPLSHDDLHRVSSFLKQPISGRGTPQIQEVDGHTRLVFLDAQHEISDIPFTASIEWAEEDGVTWRMYIGHPDAR
jgi:transcriptional regulator with XRE-family HTH domain